MSNRKDEFEKEFRKEVNYNKRFAAISVFGTDERYYNFMSEMERMLKLKKNDQNEYYIKLEREKQRKEKYKAKIKAKKLRLKKYKEWKNQKEKAIEKGKYKPIKKELNNFNNIILNENVNFDILFNNYKEKIEEQHLQYKVNNISDSINVISSINIIEILDINVEFGENFDCVIFKGNIASINKDDNGHFRYFTKNFNKDFRFYLDLIDIIQLVNQLPYYESIKKICNIAKINVAEFEWLEEQISKYKYNIKIIDNYDERITSKHPILSKYIKKHLYLLKELNCLAMKNLATRNESSIITGDSIFFASNRFIESELKNLGIKKKLSIVNVTINLFATLGLIIKVPQTLIPENLLNKAIECKDKAKHDFLVTFFSIPTMNEKLLEEAEIKVIKLKKEKISATMISSDIVYKVFGYEEATYVYFNSFNQTEHIRDKKKNKKKDSNVNISEKEEVI